ALTGCTCIILINSGMPLIVCLLAALMIGVLVGAINGFFVAIAKLPPFIVTLATQTICRGTAYLYTNGVSTPVSEPVFDFIGNGYAGPVPFPIILTVIVLAVVSLILNRTRFGRNIYALGGNRECARFSGIKIVRTELSVYVLCSLLTAVSGLILASRMGSAQPMSGDGYELDAIASAVLGGTSFNGGIGRVGGSLIGALVMGVLANGLNIIRVSYYWQLVIKGIIIVAAVYIDSLKIKRSSRSV
ncbi:MAG: ABC transporter permease, partial [Christensenellales bacterium]